MTVVLYAMDGYWYSLSDDWLQNLDKGELSFVMPKTSALVENRNDLIDS